MPLPSFRIAILISITSLLIIAIGCGGGYNSGQEGGNPNPVPAVTSINPQSAILGGAAVALTVNGSSFINSSAVQWSGVALNTTYVSGKQLQATLPASDLNTAGSFNVTVVNPMPGGGTSTALSFTVDYPSPSVTGLSPTSSSAGGAGFTLSVTGLNFASASQIAWNGTALATTFVSATSLSAQIPSSDLASVGNASITVVTPAPGGGTSGPETFMINPAGTNLTVLKLEGNDLAWDAARQKLYVSVPASSPTNGTTITVVDPIAGQIATSQSISSEAGALSITDDGQFLYASLASENSVARYDLPGLAQDIKFTLGTDSVFGPYYPLNVKAQPGQPNTVAVTMTNAQLLQDTLAIFDNATMRPNITTGTYGIYSVAWKPDGTEIFGEDQGSSDRPFYTVPINSSGVASPTLYGGEFRLWGPHLQYDSTTAFVYTDTGEIVDPASGRPVGNYADGWAQPFSSLSTIDPVQKRAFVLGPSQNSGDYEIRVYDQNQFTLLGSLLLTNVVGGPRAFLRWGQSGLALLTLGSAPNTGELYIIDGAFVSPGGPADTTMGSPINPLPILSSVTPLSATVGAGAVPVTLTGLNFSPQATVSFNGTPISAAVTSSTQIEAQIPGSALAAAGQLSFTVSDPEAGSGSSNALIFAVNPAPPSGTQVAVYNAGGNDLVWDPVQQKLYISSAGIQGALGNRIVTVDPVAGTVNATPFIGSDPYKLALSASSQYLYVGLNGANTVQRLNLPAMTPDISWTLGADSFNGPYFALGLAAAPGSPQTVAVNFGYFDVSPTSALGIFIYDNATARPVSAPGWSLGSLSYSSIAWGNSSSTLYSDSQGSPTDLYVLTVDGNGISVTTDYSRILNLCGADFDIRYDAGTGLLYDCMGDVIDPSTGNILGSFGASGIPLPDSSTNQVFFVGQTAAQQGSTNFTVESFNQTTFKPISSIVVSNVVGNPTGFVRWGASGLAFTTVIGAPTQNPGGWGAGNLYVLSGDFVKSSVATNRTAEVEPVRITWKKPSSFSPGFSQRQ